MDEKNASHFHGKRFEAAIHPKASHRSNPMTNGMDYDILKASEEKFEELQAGQMIPTSYDIHNSLNLLDIPAIDTTERSFVVNARRHHFDPEGFKEGNPLIKGDFQRSFAGIFFKSPIYNMLCKSVADQICFTCSHISRANGAT